MNFIQRWFLTKELQNLEYKLVRLEMLASVKVEQENKNNLFNRWMNHEMLQEYEYLSHYRQQIQDRVEVIKEKLRETN